MRLTARRLPRHLGPAGWSVILGSAASSPPLEQDRTADVVIIGAGFAGLSAARRLTQLEPQAQICVLDAGHVGEGAAGRNSGFMIDLPHDLASDDYAGVGDDRAMIALNRHAIDFARQAVCDYGIRKDFFDPAGKVNGAASATAHAQNESYARHLDDLDEPYTMLNAREMAELTGSRHYISGLRTSGSVMLQPAGYVRGLATGLRAEGVALYECAPVTEISRKGSDWQVVTPSAAITAPRVILTVNGHLESFGVASDQLMHVFLYAVMTPDLDAEVLRKLGGADRWGITPSDPMGTTMRRISAGQGGNRIVTRTCASLRSGMQARQSDLKRAARVMQRKFDTRFPQLAGMRMEHAWAGHLCLTRNGVAVMREIEQGLFAGCVQNGLGTARGTLTGMGAAELACGFESDITRHFSAEPSAQVLPPQSLRDPVGNMVLRWKEWRARAD